MSFVAHPFEQFSDDLLTALTGGVTREEHQFVVSEEFYSLTTPGAYPASIKVFGQYNKSFMLFENGIDYTYKGDKEAIFWLPKDKEPEGSKARHPDDHSFFYINYYLREGRRRLTDRNQGSVTSILAAAFAREWAVVHKQMEFIYRSAFVDFATDSSLDHVAALLGLNRKDAKFATGEVLFKRSTPAPGDITIPASTLVSNDQGINFETSDKRTLRKGQLSVATPIRAQQEGPIGRVEALTIKNINRPIFGLETVINEEATFFATEKETDEAFRRRIKGTIERAGKSTVNSLKFGLIDEVTDLNEGNVQITEPADLLGQVEIKLGLESPEDPDLVRRVEEAIFNARPAGIRVTHNLPTRSLSASAKHAATQQENNQGSAALVSSVRQAKLLPEPDLAKMPEGVLNLRINVFVHLTQPNVAAAEKDNILDRVRNQVNSYIKGLPMGADLIYNKLLGLVVQVNDVADADLMIGTEFASKPDDFYRTNLVTSDRKVVAKEVAITLMEEVVQIDVTIWLEPKAGSDNIESSVSQDLNADLRVAVDTELVSPREVGAQKIVQKTNLISKISDILQQDGEFQLSNTGGLFINAEYEETGRRLNNTNEVSLEAHQVARLRNFKVSLKGDLDG